MPNIVITEIDETTPGSVMESTDVVFIPGFVDTTQDALRDSGTYTGLEVNSPHLFTNLADFITLCGPNPPVFSENQNWIREQSTSTTDNGVTTKTVTASGFASEAIPTSTGSVFIKKDTPDPSYIMAKELLAAGLPVLYQRVNTDTAPELAYELVSDEIQTALSGKTPELNDTKYFYKDSQDNYASYQTKVTYPEFSSIVQGQDGNVWELFAITVQGSSTEATYDELATWYASNRSTDSDAETYIVDDDGHVVVAASKNPENYKRLEVNLYVQKGNNYVSFTDSLEESGGVPAYPETLPEGIYKFARNLGSIPSGWETDYTSYYTKSALEVDKTLEPIQASTEPRFKLYSSGNIYQKTNVDTSSISVDTMYAALTNIFSVSDDPENQDVSGLIDKGNHSVKYLTSGGYPVFEYSNLADTMLNMAKKRGDCVALIDHTDYLGREMNPYKDGSLYKSVQTHKGTTLEKGEFGAMFTPWATYSRITVDGNYDPHKPNIFRAPGSFAYLMSLADSIKTNANWLAIAGATRGGIKNLYEMDTVIPNGVADAMQPRNDISINAITNIKPYGYTIWGNRTLKNNEDQKNLVATSFLNVRNLVSDIKKTCYRVARKLTFEQDTDILWINFKAEISKLLDRMKSGYGISGYKILRDNNHEHAKAKATVCAKIIIYPVEAVEDFYITIVLKDDEVSVN